MSGTSTIRIRDAVTGETIGAGVPVGRPVKLLTCAHVATAADHFVISDAKDHHLGEVGREAFELDRDLDLAVASVAWTLTPEPVAIQFTAPRGAVTWSGFPYGQLGVHGLIAGEGRVATPTKVKINTRVVPALQLLGGPPLSPGMSGGPLVDEASGAVAGLSAAEFSEAVGGVVTRAPSLAGFALPLPRGTDGVAGRLFEAEATVARFGPDPNAAGALKLMREAGLRAATFAERNLDYAQQYFVTRGQLEDAVCAFQEGNRIVMPLVGESGVGKTTFLQGLLRETGRHCFLVRCADLEPHRDIDAVVGAALLLDRPHPPAAEGASFSTVARAIGPGLLLLDGLNELPPEVGWERNFLGRELVSLLRSLGWQAIIATRPGAWTDLERTFPEDAVHLVFPQGSEGDERRPNPVPTQLGEFLPEEALAYLAKFNAEKSLRTFGTRNPLAMSLVLRRGEVDAAALKLGDLLEFQLNESIRRIVGVQGGLGQAIINELCDGLARSLLLANRTDVLIADIHTDARADFEGLVRESVLIPAGPARWRFRYDQMLEHLQAKAISEPSMVIDDPDLCDQRLGVSVPHSVLVAAVRRQSEHRNRQQLHRSLAAAAKRNDLLFPMILQGAALVDADLAAVESALRAVPDVLKFRDGMYRDGFSDAPWRSLSVGFAILRVFALAEDGYGWRVKDVERGNYVAMNASMLELAGVVAFVSDALDKDRLTTITILKSWLVDPTPMRGSEGTLSSWTLNLIDILKARIGEVAALKLALGVPNVDFGNALMLSLAREEGYGLSALEAVRDDPALQPDRLLRGIHIILSAAENSAAVDEDFALRAYTLLAQPYVEPDLEGSRLTLLARLPGQTDRAWATYKAEVEAGQASLAPMRVFLNKRPDDAFLLLQTHWRGLGIADDVASAICSVCPTLTAQTDPAVLAAWRQRLAFLETLITEHGQHFKYAIERLLYQTDLEAAKKIGLVELVLASLHGCDEAFARNLIYPLCGRGPDSFAQREALERHFCLELVGKGPPHASAAILAGLEETVSRSNLFYTKQEIPDRFYNFIEEVRARVRARGDVTLSSRRFGRRHRP